MDISYIIILRAFGYDKKIIRDIQFFFRDISINKKIEIVKKNYDFSIPSFLSQE